jgi:hypothetical protein
MESETGASHMLTYLLIFITALFGLVHQPWWLAAASASFLATAATLQDKLPMPLTTTQATELASYTVFARLSLSVAAAASAFLLGKVCGWLFGI